MVSHQHNLEYKKREIYTALIGRRVKVKEEFVGSNQSSISKTGQRINNPVKKRRDQHCQSQKTGGRHIRTHVIQFIRQFGVVCLDSKHNKTRRKTALLTMLNSRLARNQHMNNGKNDNSGSNDNSSNRSKINNRKNISNCSINNSKSITNRKIASTTN